MTRRLAYAYQTPALTLALVMAFAMPSVAANKKDLTRGPHSLVTGIDNITAGRAPERGADKYRLARYSSGGETLVNAAKKRRSNGVYEGATLFATLVTN